MPDDATPNGFKPKSLNPIDIYCVHRGVSLQCDVDGDVEYEFPCLNCTEATEGLWSIEDPLYKSGGVYGGVLLRVASVSNVASLSGHGKGSVPAAGGFSGPMSKRLLWVMFPRIQVQLRSHFAQKHEEDFCDLYQWSGGSKCCSGSVECIVSLDSAEDSISVKVRGPRNHEKECFFFLEEILGVVDQVLLEMSPGMGVDKYVLSSRDLRNHEAHVHPYSPCELVRSLMGEEGFDSALVHPKTGLNEKLQDLLCFGSPEVATKAVP